MSVLTSYDGAEEVERMKKKPLPVVYCQYSQSDTELVQLLQEAFCRYLRQRLQELV